MSNKIWKEIMELMGIKELVGNEEWEKMVIAVDIAIHNLSKTINFLTNPFIYVIVIYFVSLWVSITIPMSLHMTPAVLDDPIDIPIYFIIGPISLFWMIIIWEIARVMKVKLLLILFGFIAILLLYLFLSTIYYLIHFEKSIYSLMYQYR